MNSVEQKNFFDDFDVIDVYSRTEAIEDGLLVDLSSTAREAGVPYPVAVTSSVYADCIGFPVDDSVWDENERVTDLLTTVSAFVRMAKGEREVMFEMPIFDDDGECQPIALKLTCGPGDMGEPVLTIMKPDED
jgi:hypothetical protein